MSKLDYISETFEKEVVLHALRINWLNIKDAPLILGINGKPGEGKTYQCNKVLNKIGYKVFHISGGALEHKDAGHPSRVVESKYKDAQDYCKNEKSNRAAILIDDIDVAIGNWGEMYQYTVNTQNLLATFMNLTDYHKETKQDLRIPIYMTGNDLKKIYSPLRRSGRMNFFNWEPSDEDRLKTISFMFQELTTDECEKLLRYASDKLIQIEQNVCTAFFADIKASAYDSIIWEHYYTARNNSFNSDFIFNMEVPSNLPPIKYEDLIRIIDKKVESIKKSNISYITSSQ